LAAAKEAGIPVFLAGGYGDVNEEKGIYGNTFQNDVLLANLGLLDKMIVDSEGNGSVLLVNAPDFPPLKPVDAAAQELIDRECPECSITLLGISAADLGGDIASNIVATVRQNPEIKYVVAAFTDLARGLPQALEAAGLDDVKIYVSQPDDATVQLIEKGDIDAGALPPKQTFGWATVDMMARYSVGMPVLQDEVSEFSMWIWTPDTMPEGETSWDPTDYQERYMKLWQVS
jgi:ABC-type sugar transport system substrate-binding protein